MDSTQPSTQLAESVLIIDDEQDIRESVGMLATIMGHTPVLAQSAAEGLRWLLEEGLQPCVIVLDLTMADNGAGFMKNLLALSTHRNIPVILVTGSSLSREQLSQHRGYRRIGVSPSRSIRTCSCGP